MQKYRMFCSLIHLQNTLHMNSIFTAIRCIQAIVFLLFKLKIKKIHTSKGKHENCLSMLETNPPFKGQCHATVFAIFQKAITCIWINPIWKKNDGAVSLLKTIIKNWPLKIFSVICYNRSQRWHGLKFEKLEQLNPLSPSTYIKILQTNLYIFP